jgi:hypothetical protein
MLIPWRYPHYPYRAVDENGALTYFLSEPRAIYRDDAFGFWLAQSPRHALASWLIVPVTDWVKSLECRSQP